MTGAAVLLLLIAQTEMPPAFEVASVKPVEARHRGAGPLRGGPGTNSPGRLSGIASMKTLLLRAYDVTAYQLSGPGWMDTERYEIDARIPAGATREQVATMLQSLLAQRFRLAVHRETHELPVFELTAGRGGPKLLESSISSEEAGNPRLTAGPDGYPELAAGSKLSHSYEVVIGGSDGARYQHWARHETMQQLAARLSSQLNRLVIDRTGLTGQYDFSLSWTTDGGTIARTDPPPDMIETHNTPVSDPGLTLFSALQKELGLRLESKKASVPVVVVDHIEKVPTAN